MKSQEIRRNSFALLLHNTVNVNTISAICRRVGVGGSRISLLSRWYCSARRPSSFGITVYSDFIHSENWALSVTVPESEGIEDVQHVRGVFHIAVKVPHIGCR